MMPYLRLLIATLALCWTIWPASVSAEEIEEQFLHHILVEHEATAIRLHQELQAAGIERRRTLFAALAREYSKDPGSGVNGGALGWAKRGVYVPEFQAAADRLGIEQFSAPVKTAFGWHLLMLTDKRHVQAREENSEAEWDLVRSLVQRSRLKLSSRWELVSFTNQAVIQIDTQSIARSGGKAKGWFLQTSVKPNNSVLQGRTYKSLKTQHAANCVERSFARIQWIEYEDEFGSGEALGSGSIRDEPSHYTSPAPETVGELMLAKLCRTNSRKQ